MKILHTFLITISIFSSFLIFLSNNPVHSVLFLIFTIINSSIILFLFNAEFLGLIFIIIYVGAIAILFLFVVMMLNVKIVKLNFLSFLPLIIIVSFIGFFNIFTLLEFLFTEYDFLDFNSYTILIDNLSNIDVIGQSLYNYYISVFLIAGFILLVAMIGAICLTLKFSSIRKNELSNRQLSRSNHFLSFLK
jgi:NADH-quinone oxidoreductase subunit J